VLYRLYPAIWPEHYWTIFAIGAASVGVLAGAWWALARFALARATCALVDVVVTTCCGAVFGATAMLASNRPESAYTCLFYACFVVFMRTIVVPSSGARTVAVSALALLPLLVAALDLAVTTVQDVPGTAYFAGAAVFIAGAIAVAATGSRVIYGLRRRVSSLARDDLELGQYTLVRKLGEGATGAVFLARHALLRRPTAIKLVQPNRAELLARCERAVQQMSQLSHHNTVAVYDYGRSPDGVFYFAMELLEGLNLAALRDGFGAQPAGRVVAVVVQLCGALHEAHQRGVAHGNIKASNVILCERGGLCDVAKLTDFGFGALDASAADDLEALRALAVSLVDEDAAPAIAVLRGRVVCQAAGGVAAVARQPGLDGGAGANVVGEPHDERAGRAGGADAAGRPRAPGGEVVAEGLRRPTQHARDARRRVGRAGAGGAPNRDRCGDADIRAARRCTRRSQRRSKEVSSEHEARTVTGPARRWSSTMLSRHRLTQTRSPSPPLNPAPETVPRHCS
jgi:hypothetical protein